MHLKRLLAIAAFAAVVFIPSSLRSQAGDSAKSPSPGTVIHTLPSHRPSDSGAAQSVPSAPTGPDTDTLFGPNDWMVIESHHRMFPDFVQLDTVKPRERFQIGEDGPYAEVVKFVADLKLTMKGEKTKMSDTLYNPAVLLRVYLPDSASQRDSLIQESWAFYYGSAPHFSRQAFFAFLLRDFKVENPKYVSPPKGE